MSAAGFWDNPEKAQDVGRKRSRVEKRIQSSQSLGDKSEELGVLLDLKKEGEIVDADIDALVNQLEREIHDIELTMKLSGEHDDHDAILAIHPGAGAVSFAAVVVLTMFAAMSFDPRLIWDAAARSETPLP